MALDDADVQVVDEQTDRGCRARRAPRPMWCSRLLWRRVTVPPVSMVNVADPVVRRDLDAGGDSLNCPGRRRVCGLCGTSRSGVSVSSLPVMVFELNRRQVSDRGVEPVAVVPVDPAGDLPFDLAPVGPGRPGQVDRFGLEQPDGRFAQGVV